MTTRTDSNSFSEVTTNTVKKPMNRYQLLLNDQEFELLNKLKKPPYCMDMQNFFRMTLKRLYAAKTEKKQS